MTSETFPIFSKNELLELAIRYAHDSPESQTLQAKDGKRVCRIQLADGQFAVLKLGVKIGWHHKVRQILRTDALHRELRMLRHLQRHGIRVPAVLGTRRMVIPDAPYRYMMLVEDLGDFGNATATMHRFLESGQLDKARIFEDDIIDLTAAMLNAKVVDSDHSMINMVLTESGKPARLDLELARHVVSPRLFPRTWAAMIGRLAATFTFAVQPDVKRAEDFCHRLAHRVGAPQPVLHRAKDVVDHLLERQRRQSGIDTRIALPW